MKGDVDDLILRTRTLFDPVMSRLGTKGPKIDKANTYFFLGYFGSRLGLQLAVELGPLTVLPMFFRPPLFFKKVPVQFWDSSGRAAVLHLGRALEKLGLDYPELPEIRRLDKQRDLEAIASTLAKVIEKNWVEMSRRVDELSMR